MALAYVSVDVETSGPAPGRYSLLSVGASPLRQPGEMYYVEVKPRSPVAVAEAIRVSGLDLDRLATEGQAPEAAMASFAAWAREMAGGDRLVFVGVNAPFDWMFVADYFDRYHGENPFGHSALDLKSLFMGVAGVPWSETGFAMMRGRYGLAGGLTHHAGWDAVDQAEVARRLFDEAGLAY